MFLGSVTFFLGVVPVVLFFLIIVVFARWGHRLAGRLPYFGLGGWVNIVKGRIVSLFFLGHLSSQYSVGGVVYYGGRFVLIVDQGWVEWGVGYGVGELLKTVYVKVLQLMNQGAVPLFFLIGVFSFCLVLSV